jgi:hypothetical protein
VVLVTRDRLRQDAETSLNAKTNELTILENSPADYRVSAGLPRSSTWWTYFLDAF